MIETLRTSIRVFIPKGQRVKWLGLIVIALAVAAAETLTALLIFRVLGYATDPQPDSPSIALAFGLEATLFPLLFLAGAVFVLRGLLSMFSIYAQNRAVQNAGAAVASLIHRRYLQAPYSFHLSRNSSESLRTVLWSVDRATDNALTPIINIATQGLISATLFVLLVAIAPVLSLTAVFVLAVGLALILRMIQPRLGHVGKVVEDTVHKLIVSVRDSFDSVRDIKAYRAEAYFDRRFRGHRKTLARLRTTKSLLDQIPSAAVEYMVVIGLLILIGVASNSETFGEYVPILGAFGYATLRIVPSINKIVSSANRIKYGEQAVKNVENDLRAALPQEAPDPDVSASPEPLFSDSIELCDLSFTYAASEQRAIDSVDLVIRRGEILAVAGGSGSGKSTLADIVLGLLEPESGKIIIDGSEVLPEGWHRKVGIVSQSVVLLDASVRENVAFGDSATADDDRILEALDRARLTEWLRTLPAGLDTEVGESGKLLSGGERQRVAIARSLYRHPDLLILDEATSALDGATEAALMDSLVALSGELTTIIVSHRLAPIQAADRVVMMSEGKITAVGTFEELASGTAAFRDLVGM